MTQQQTGAARGRPGAGRSASSVSDELRNRVVLDGLSVELGLACPTCGSSEFVANPDGFRTDCRRCGATVAIPLVPARPDLRWPTRDQLVPKPADEPGTCPVCQTAQTTMPRRTPDGYLSVWCFDCQTWRRIGC